MKNISISLCLTGIVVLVMLLAANSAFVNVAEAQIEEVKVHVKGLACPFCVNGVEKHLKKVNGVKSLSTSLKAGEVTLNYEPGIVPDVNQINEAVVHGGFTPGLVSATVVGILIEKNGSIILQSGDKKSGDENVSFLLFTSKAQRTKLHNYDKASALSEEMVGRLKKLVLNKHRVRITGTVHSHKGFLPVLSVDNLEDLSV